MCQNIDFFFQKTPYLAVHNCLFPIDSGWLAMAMLSQLSEEIHVQKYQLFGGYFILYSAKYVKIMEKRTKNALINVF